MEECLNEAHLLSVVVGKWLSAMWEVAALPVCYMQDHKTGVEDPAWSHTLLLRGWTPWALFDHFLLVWPL